jgi:hypothetical protein
MLDERHRNRSPVRHTCLPASNSIVHYKVRTIGSAILALAVLERMPRHDTANDIEEGKLVINRSNSDRD